MIKLYTFIILAYFSQSATAQNIITISDSLVASADILPVKLGSLGLGKVWKLHFGDYGILSSKKNWTTGGSKTNLLGTKTESKTTDKFSFVLGNKSNDTAFVNAANNIRIKAVQEVEIIPHFFWGESELKEESHNFTAFISINGDTGVTWTLYVNTATGTQVDSKNEAFLTNGDRRIDIVHANPVKTKTMFGLPVSGYEFFEGSRSLCALQYSAMYKNIIWIYKDLDPKMKILLAAGATAILQLKLIDPGNEYYSN